MTDEEITIEVDASAGDKSGQSNGSSGGGGGGRRGTVAVKGQYGTEQYPPDTLCDECNTRAVGVAIHEKTRERGEAISPGVPLCGKHRDKKRDDEVADWDNWEFRRFIDA